LAVVAVALGGSGCGRRDVIVEHIKFNARSQVFEVGRSTVTTFLNRLDPSGEESGEEDPGTAYSPRVRDLTGKYVVVKGGGRILLDLCRSSVVDVETVTREEFYNLGVITAPEPVYLQYDVDNLDRNMDLEPDGAIVPADHDSLAMMSGYVNYDNVARFYRDLGDTSRATQVPATVAFYAETGLGCDLLGTGRTGLSVPLHVADNAMFATAADMFIILRDAFMASGLELGVNPGVSAHEYGHRVFEHNVFFSDAAFRVHARRSFGSEEVQGGQCTFMTPAEQDLCVVTDSFMTAVNEGCADIFAYTFTGRSDFFLGRSLGSSPLAMTEPGLRDLAQEANTEEDIPLYAQQVVEAAKAGELHPYRLGTLWSRGFYHGIVEPGTGAAVTDDERRTTLAKEVYAPAVIRALRRLGDDLVANYRLDPRQLVRRYIEEVARDRGTGGENGNIRAGVCQSLCSRFGYMAFDTAVNGAGPQCPGRTATNPVVAGGFSCTL
jgi:hypothetical protein